MYLALNIRVHLLYQMSTCTGLAALDHANSKFSRGYATTGVGVGMCARHEFIQKNGVGDLQKGERCVYLHRSSHFTQSSYIFLIDKATWIMSSHQPFVTTAPRYQRLCHMTSRANGQYTSLNASSNFHLSSTCTSSSL